MDTLIVTTSIASLNRVVDLELSSDAPMQELLPQLTEKLNLPQTQANKGTTSYRLVLLRNGVPRALAPHETLQDAHVLTGDYLSLVQTGMPLQAVAIVRAGPTALLRTQADKIIVLDNFGVTRLRIGRYDARSGIAPEIDLSDDPDGKTISRDHARLNIQGGQWALIAVSHSSRTCVNDQQLSPGQTQPLKSGDRLKLGDVELSFEITTPQ